MAHLPTNELVGISWIKTIEGIPENSVASKLPADAKAWEAEGFVQVQVASGNPDVYTPQRQPIYQINCWAAKPNSEKPPWGKANNLAELIVQATWEKKHWGHLVLPATHDDARVLGSKALTEPRRVFGDEARFACYTFDLQLFWVRK